LNDFRLRRRILTQIEGGGNSGFEHSGFEHCGLEHSGFHIRFRGRGTAGARLSEVRRRARALCEHRTQSRQL
jgi:hypothetical protein